MAAKYINEFKAKTKSECYASLVARATRRKRTCIS